MDLRSPSRKEGEPKPRLRHCLKRSRPAQAPSCKENGGWWKALREDGGTLVESALASAVLLSIVIGILEMSFALYNFHFVSEAAREATRYAIVRGSASCTNTPNLTNCNATSAEIQSYVRNLGFPNSTNLNATTTWLSAVSSGSPPTTTWTSCTAGTCNAPGNVVNVVVTEAAPLAIPFWGTATINLTSTSQMVISQ